MNWLLTVSLRALFCCLGSASFSLSMLPVLIFTLSLLCLLCSLLLQPCSVFLCLPLRVQWHLHLALDDDSPAGPGCLRFWLCVHAVLTSQHCSEPHLLSVTSLSLSGSAFLIKFTPFLGNG